MISYYTYIHYMPNKKIRGRYDAPPYIEYIHNKFKENFPDNVPSEYIIDQSIKFFIKYIEEQLIAQEPLNIFAFGKFYTKARTSPVTGKEQFYPKLKFSRHFILKFREAKGTSTEAEKKELELKREFMRRVWSKRKEFILRERGKLPKTIENFEPKHDSDIKVTEL